MDNLELAKALFGTKPQQPNGGQTTTTYGVAVGDSENGIVRVNLGGDTISPDDDQTVEIETTFAVREGDEVITTLIGADNTGKAPVVTGVVGRGDQQQKEIESVTNYVWNDEHGLHVSTEERSVQGANILLDYNSLDIRNGNSNSEADQTVYASFGREVTVGSRGTIPGQGQGQYSQVYGEQCIANGSYSHAEGYSNTVTGGYSHVEGASNTVGAMYSHAEGMSNVIDAKDGQGITVSYSHVEGRNNSLKGDSSHVEGWNNTVVGQYHHVEGSNNDVEAGYGNHVEGVYNETNGSLYSVHVEGAHNISSSDYQHVQGKYNVEDANGTYHDIIGNGVSNARSNAYNMDWNGNAEFQGVVYVGGCTPNGETPYPVMRYNSTLSRAEYYNGSAWVEFSGGGGGGAFAYIVTNYPAGSTCTATNGVTTLTAPDTSGVYVFEIPSPATWTVSATDGVDTDSVSVVISSHYQVETVNISYNLWLIRNGIVQDGFTTALAGISSGAISQGDGYLEHTVPKVGSSYTQLYFTPKLSFPSYHYLVYDGQQKGYWYNNPPCPSFGVATSTIKSGSDGGSWAAIVATRTARYDSYATRATYTLDISNVSGEYWIASLIASSSGQNVTGGERIYNLYLTNVMPE